MKKRGEIIGDKVRRLRAQHGLTLQQFSAIVEISYGSLPSYETGKTVSFQPKHLQKMIEYFKLDANYFYIEENDEPKKESSIFSGLSKLFSVSTDHDLGKYGINSDVEKALKDPSKAQLVEPKLYVIAINNLLNFITGQNSKIKKLETDLDICKKKKS
jgi:transcriptional regulator with XRE-family HTH domain